MNEKSQEFYNKLVSEIPKRIEKLTLFSDDLTCAFNDKDFTSYTLRALNVIEMDEEMKSQMQVHAEHTLRAGAGKRGARLDVLVTLPNQKVHIEIQKVRKSDEIARTVLYRGILASNVPKGVRLIPKYNLISVWICNFNPLNEKGVDLPYYVFETMYTKTDGVIGIDTSFKLDDGVKLIIVNGKFRWDKIKRPLTEKEKAIKEYMEDMKQSNPQNIRHKEASDVLFSYKEGGVMYNKLVEDYSKKYAKELRAVKEEGVQEGLQKGMQKVAKAMLLDGFPIEAIERYTKLDSATLEKHLK